MPPVPGSPTPRSVLLPRTIADGRAGRCRDHDAVGDRSVPTGREDPSRRRDAPRTRFRGDAHTTPRRRCDRHVPRASRCSSSGCSSARVARGASIGLAGGGALLLFLGIASLSSTIASPVTRVLGWPIAEAVQGSGRARPRERCPISSQDLIECVGTDDRRRAREQHGGLRVVAACEPGRHPRERRLRRLHHHRRGLPRSLARGE